MSWLKRIAVGGGVLLLLALLILVGSIEAVRQGEAWSELLAFLDSTLR